MINTDLLPHAIHRNEQLLQAIKAYTFKDRNFMEFINDTLELRKIVDKVNITSTDNDDDLYTFIHLFDYLMISSTIMGHQEATNIETCQKFQAKYPGLFKTMLVWAWG